MGLEIHHIQPKAEGGINTEDNAAPLCPSCHRSFGGNRELRSRIREMRDDWYKKCEVLFTNGSRPNEVFNSIYETFSVEELERLTVHNPVYVLGTEETECELESTSFSFHHEEYVHPLIVKELLGWISDSSSTVVSVDLGAANRSNRFWGDFSVNSDEAKALVESQDAEAIFVYRHVATTPSGVEVVECYDYGGGSGVFGTIGFFCLERDRALETGDGLRFSRERKVLKILGQCGLGDRYDGDIQYNNGVLEVGPDKGWFKMGKEASWRLPVL